MLTSAARQFFFQSPPRAAQLGVPGGVVSITVSTTASYIELDTLFPQLPSAGVSASVAASNNAYMTQQNGCCDQFISVYAASATIGIIFGPTAASVTTAGSLYNAPNLSVVGTVSSGAYTLPAASSGSPGISCLPIPPGIAPIRFRITTLQDKFMGFVGSGAGILYLYQSSQSDS